MPTLPTPTTKPVKPVKPVRPRPLQTDRILMYGLEGAGKTECYLSLARQFPGATFHVLDLDGSVSYSLGHTGLDTVNVWDASDPMGALILPDGRIIECDTQWGAISAGAQAIRAAKPKPSDWIVLERIDKAWDAVQAHWISKAYNDSETDYWVDVREILIGKDNKDERAYGGFSGARDWPYIRKAYNSVILGLLTAPGTNKFATTLAKEPFPQASNIQELKALYGDMMPAGEKNQSAEFWLVVEVKQKVNGERNLFIRRTKRYFDVKNPYLITAEGVSSFGHWYSDTWLSRD